MRFPMAHRASPQRRARSLLAALVLLLLAAGALPARPTLAAGSNILFPAGHSGSRANIEWRTSNYGGGALKRRTLFYLYVQAGEYIQVASSAVGVSRSDGGVQTTGDIFIYNPGLIDGVVGQETLAGGAPLVPTAANASFSCLAQRAATPGTPALGRITSRAQELAGPLPSPGGFPPCTYRAPVTGLYNVIFTGPAGSNSDLDLQPSGEVESTTGGANFGPEQGASVSSWDITVRSSNPDGSVGAVVPTGRLFTYYISASTGANNRQLDAPLYIVTTDGYRYRMDLRGLDPWGFILYANRVGFYDSDGATPLYRNIMADPGAARQQQNQLDRLQGGVSLALPDYPIFGVPPDDATLRALGIPLAPVLPAIVNGLTFTGTNRIDNRSLIGTGGVFRYATNTGGVDELVISRDGTNFDPSNPDNAVVRGVRVSNSYELAWDGRDNKGVVFPAGTYRVRLELRGGELHFPILDAENSVLGGPTVTLLNPVGGVCPPGPDGAPLCTAAYYDDRGYRTREGTVIGEINGQLCPGAPGGPPQALISGAGLSGLAPFDSASTQRGYGLPQSLPAGGNAGQNCSPTGSFGDTKGLDLWTYTPGAVAETELIIFEEPTAIDLVSFTAVSSAAGVILTWRTGAEVGTWGFNLYRGDHGSAEARRLLNDAIIPSQGRGGTGATYEWVDPTPPGPLTQYWLEEVELDGDTVEYGPIGVQVAAGPDR